jgi:phosphatidylethanolamine/phosphatidyl-N-methylethanolamine N-methyltransferase
MDQPSIKRAYRRYASVYDLVFGPSLQEGRRALSRSLKTRPGDKLLEMGVGTGLMLPMYPRDIEIVGIDISEEMLEVARKRVDRDAMLNVRLELMDCEHTSFEAHAFDHVVIPYVYSVTPDPLQLIREARRVCKPGGTIYLVNHFTDTGMWRWLERLLRPFAKSLGFRPEFSLKRYVHDMQWSDVKIRSVNLLGLSRLVLFTNSD